MRVFEVSQVLGATCLLLSIFHQVEPHKIESPKSYFEDPQRSMSKKTKKKKNKKTKTTLKKEKKK